MHKLADLLQLHATQQVSSSSSSPPPPAVNISSSQPATAIVALQASWCKAKPNNCAAAAAAVAGARWRSTARTSKAIGALGLQTACRCLAGAKVHRMIGPSYKKSSCSDFCLSLFLSQVGKTGMQTPSELRVFKSLWLTFLVYTHCSYCDCVLVFSQQRTNTVMINAKAVNQRSAKVVASDLWRTI
jgi:hypothetical protein